ncbi:hypothetical protein AGOR_G00138440 [Albula goreensis]|uniref:Uncharacterized protein n=1 Tax=Albula goreensis TaxID=1534307 RepID=A0A8T3D9G1_9TELE|nr:hypothetical protein AGOR_G00138440 [Albula goreensis]
MLKRLSFKKRGDSISTELPGGTAEEQEPGREGKRGEKREGERGGNREKEKTEALSTLCPPPSLHTYTGRHSGSCILVVV